MEHREVQRVEKWHIGREIPIALLIFIVSQTGVMIWWAATQTEKTNTLIGMMNEFKKDQYSKDDARRDNELDMIRHQDNRRRIEVLEARAVATGKK